MENQKRCAGRGLSAVLAAALTLGFGGCSSQSQLPSPRPLIIHSGARLTPSEERIKEIDAWVPNQLTDIREDPTFLIRTLPRDERIYPWEGLDVTADTANMAMQGGVPEARIPYMIYAHLHLMHRRGELLEWLPEGVGSPEGFALEHTILQRTSDAWLYGRSGWDAPPHEVMDEIMYAREHGYLEAMIFTARPEAYPDARQAWVDENPGAIEQYRRWFVETFDREPPGLRREEGAGAPEGWEPFSRAGR